MDTKAEDNKSTTDIPTSDGIEVESEKQESVFIAYIDRMCSAFNWKTRELDNEHAVLEFSVDQIRPQTLFVFNFDDELEFSVPSFAAFETIESVPHYISSSLLQVNAKMKVGFWCIESIGNKLVFSCMHNAKISQTDEKLFHEIITTLVQRVDEFEKLLIKMSEVKPGGDEPEQ